jgi:predicted amidohydrolase
MKIALYQGPDASYDIEQNLARMTQLAERAAAEGARLLITAEMFLCGYNIGAEAIAARAQSADGAAALRVAEIASSHDIAILYGYAERDGDAIYNAAQMIDRDGVRLANYRKTHLFGDIDRDAFSPGEQANVTLKLDDWHIGLLICYDVEFPENLRRLALAGVDFVAVPTALMQPYDYVARGMLPTRAFENSVFIAYANRCGIENGLEYCGLSCVVAPDGNDLARADTASGLIYAELDKALMQRWRQINTYLPDRKPALYQSLCDDNNQGAQS